MKNFKTNKKVLKNGLSILVLENHAVPKVSCQLWYSVGSKDEKSQEKGIAHFIEHMIFKGTEKLSESDINLITHKLSGSCNAFTSYDYTGYLFDFPSAVWHESLSIMADCMRNCTFKQQFLNSEVKAVIQELKMYNDDFSATLIEKMISILFPDHPYHNPIIGYKSDLWSLNRDSLIRFYQKHYIPNNASLVVVGDVLSDDVFKQAEQAFCLIKPDYTYKKEVFNHTADLISSSITLYKEVQRPFFLYAFVVPGLKQRMDYVLDCMTWIIGAGKGSRLYRALVEERNSASDVNCFVYDLFDQSVLFIQVDPYDKDSEPLIRSIIMQELEALRKGDIDLDELNRAIKKTEVDFLSLAESNQKMAYIIGKYYTALGDEHYLEDYIQLDSTLLKQSIVRIALDYLSPSLICFGSVLPVNEQDKRLLTLYQNESDKQDTRVLNAITRDYSVEDGAHVHAIPDYSSSYFDYPQPEQRLLKNGLKIISFHDAVIPKIEIIIDFQVKYFYDPEDKQGISTILFDMLQEGTDSYDSLGLAKLIESSGMTLGSFPGVITLSMLSEDFVKGLSILKEIIIKATLPSRAFTSVKDRISADRDDFWDDPQQFIGQLVREQVYNHHPYHKNILGTAETLASITYNDIKTWYSRVITPYGTRIAVVGDVSNYNILTEIEKIFGDWQGKHLAPMPFTLLPRITEHELTYPLMRDQITLAFAGLSVSRNDADFDALLLFDQIFSGGVLGSMSSRLFELRERSGLFYTIGGSLIASADQQPGIVYIKTIVSPDRLAEAERSIKDVINQGADALNQEELNEAVRAITSSIVDNFSSMRKKASTFLFMDTFNLSSEFFKNRYDQLSSISINYVKTAVKKYLDTSKMVTIKIGRV